MKDDAPRSARIERVWHQRMLARATIAYDLLTQPARMPAAGAAPWPAGRVALWAAAALVGFIVFAWAIDAAAIVGARGLPRWVVSSFDEVTDFGKSGYFLWPLGVVLLLIAAMPDRLPRPLQLTLTAITVRIGFIFAAIAVPSLFATIVKRLIGRGRPFVGGEANAFNFDPFAWTPAFASLPSGHATTAAAAAVAISTLWPRTRTVMWTYAAVIMLSRVVVTAHHPTDVIAGALVGAAGAVLVRRYFAARHLGFAIAADGTIVHFPGPSLRRTRAVARALLAD